MSEQTQLQREEIAIIGMACRLPGAPDVEQFWRNLRDGVESIVPLNDADLAAAGVDSALLRNPAYVRASASLDDAESFDAEFFGILPKDAAIIDPQQRLFLECCWTALEHGGCDPQAFTGRIGVFGGVARNTYLLNNIATNPEHADTTGLSQMWLGNDKDFVATRVSHRLNLRGPGVNVQAACSTSGVATHLACQSLLLGECDMALAGGARIQVPLRAGYIYQEGGILSPDGHCRPFDAKANGTVVGSGGAVILLKRLSDALRDGDTIHAVIKGSAINNDGSAKVGFTAPSIPGQAAAIAEAHAVAEVDPGTISYVETHGTGTLLGDPIEVAALTKAFRAGTRKNEFCAIGSVKSNIGHLDAGAGAAGIIKTALALKHRQIPPSLHFQQPNPQIDFKNSPFFVNAKLCDWVSSGIPRRAGVSSFGLGGTNAHIVLEEAPQSAATLSRRTWQVLTLSARSKQALEQQTERLATHLSATEQHPADTAFTLQTGRREFEHRRIVVCRDAKGAAAALKACDARAVFSQRADHGARTMVFMFPGGGAQHPNMGLDVYREEPVFRRHVDECLELLKSREQMDLRDVIHPRADRISHAAAELERPSLGLPALFLIEYALAKLWISWGVRPAAMIGHSMGEYTAACISGVLSLEDALALVACRGRLFEKVPAGAMISVPLPEMEVAELPGELSLAAANAPSLSVISGPVNAIQELQANLAARGVECVRLKISVAAHSVMLEPILQEFRQFVRGIKLSAPRIPYVSNVTGEFVTDTEATDPEYFVRHLRHTVRFSQGLQRLLMERSHVFLETGPGRTLSSLVGQHPQRNQRQAAFVSLRHPKEEQSDAAILAASLGKLWAEGAAVDWNAYHAGERRQRVPLPTYPFERKRCWIDPHARKQAGATVSAQKEGSALTMAEPKKPETVNDRHTEVEAALKQMFKDLSGIEPERLGGGVSFFELGFDSLFLTRAAMEIERRLKVKVTFRQLLDELTTLNDLSTFVSERVPAGVLRAEPQFVLAGVSERASGPSLPVASTAPAMPADSVQRIIDQQLQVMAQQLALLQNGATKAPQPSLPGTPATCSGTEQRAFLQPSPSVTTHLDSSAVPKAHGPYLPLAKSADGSLTPKQRAHLDGLIARYTKKTVTSKRIAQQNRARFADPRAISGFRPQWKEMVYPTVAARTQGSKMWDVDGNEYIDLVMGYGIYLFGHSPEFVTRALDEQLKQSMAIGPQNALAGKIADLFCEMTGAERITFCNTGSEAVLAAIRVARTVSGRTKIAIFADSYHGMFDEMLVRAANIGGQRSSAPVAPGIPPQAGREVVILDYGNPESLDVIRAHRDELAAVLVEPVQSKHPDLQPRQFVQQLRALTQELDIALIFDEMITGFRIHPGGAQAHFGVKADLAAYGKIAGGGMPIGILGGRSKYMDALDGGAWNFGDDSTPEASLTYFAGTFVRHPLALAACWAALKHLKSSGPALQQTLNDSTARIADALNTSFKECGAPLKVLHFGSVFKLGIPQELSFANLIFFHLREKGIDTWERRNCFLSTAHSDEDIRRVIDAFKQSVAEMQANGFLHGAPENDARDARVFLQSGNADDGHTLIAAPHDGAAQFPLSDAQKEIWYACQMGVEASCAYNEATAIHLRGQFDSPALQRALNQITNRHEALRTTFSSAGEWQQIGSGRHIEAATSDLEADPEQTRKLADVMREECREPFDLVCGPLWRLRILKLAPEHHVLVVTFHHLIADGWSIGLFLNELSALYSIERGAQTAVAAPTQFRQFAQWQEQHAAEMAKDEAYWLRQFATPPQVLELPCDGPRPAVKSYNAGQVKRKFDEEASRALRKLSGEQRCTLFVTLFAGFQLLLHRLSRQSDIVTGVTAAGQPRMGAASLIGHCVNTLPVRQQIDPSQTVAQYIKSTKKIVLDAFDHQGSTFGALIPKLKLPRDASRTPLVEATFNFEKAEEATFAGLAAEIECIRKDFINFDLFVNVRQKGDEFECVCNYNASLFESATMQRWLGHFETLLKNMALDASVSIARVPLLTPSERRHLLEDFNPTATEYPSDQCVHQLVEAQALRTPNAIAVEFEGRRLTYAQLEARSNRLARHLRSLGVANDDLVGLYLERSEELAVALLAIHKAGAAYVPIDPALPAGRIATMLEDARPRVVVTQEKLCDAVRDSRVVCLDRDHAAIAAQSDAKLDTVSTPDTRAYVLYTSGSTGKPKGVQVTQRGLVNVLASVQKQPGITATDLLLAVTTISFDIATLEFFLPLTVGAKIVIAPRDVAADGIALAAKIESCGATILQATPSTWQMLVDAGWKGKADLKAFCGGDVLSRELVEKVLGGCASFWNMYGPTETTIYSTVCRVLSGRGPVLFGGPVANTQIYLLDTELQPVPIGVPGEVYIAGDGLARGYLNKPELTAEKFVANPFALQSRSRMYRTGDLARYRSGGLMEFLGRSDFQLKIRGFRIEPGDIEAALSRHPQVRQNAVIARDDPSGNKFLAAYIVPDTGLRPGSAELRAFLKDQLPEYMVPSAFEFLPAFPLTSSGKVDRRALPAVSARATDAFEFVAPKPGVETQLAAIWAEVLKVERVGAQDNFFELGGHSLLATQILSRVRDRLQVTLPLRAMFEAPTVAGMAAAISKDVIIAADERIVPIERTGPAPVSFSQQRMWFLDQLEPGNPAFNIHFSLRLTGALPVPVLERALTEIVRRHEILRTSFTAKDGTPQQIAGVVQQIVLPTIDLRPLTFTKRDAELRRLANAEVQHRFDLSRAPLFRVRLVRMADDEHILLWTIHHTLFDGWSLDIFIRELCAIYGAFIAGKPSPLKELPLQYADYAAWQQKNLDSDAMKRQLAYWRKQLGGRLPVMDLPSDRPRPQSRQYSGARQTLLLPAELARDLKVLAQSGNTSLFAVLLTTFSILLNRLTSQEDVIIGAPTAGRTRAEIEGLIGCFVNTLVLRNDLSGDPNVREALRRAKDVVLNAQSHQDVPFEVLVRELQPKRDLSRTPLFQVFFNMLNLPGGNAATPECPITIERASLVDVAEAKYDLSLYAREERDGIALTAIYNADLLERETVARMLEQYKVIAEGMVRNPGARLSELLMNAAVHSTRIDSFNSVIAD